MDHLYRDHLHVYCAGYCLRCGEDDPWLDDDMDHAKEEGFKLGVAQFRRALLTAIDEFSQQRSATIEEARGADYVAEIVHGLTRCEYCCKWLLPVEGKLPDHLSQTGYQCPNVGQDANHQTRDNWP